MPGVFDETTAVSYRYARSPGLLDEEKGAPDFASEWAAKSPFSRGWRSHIDDPNTHELKSEIIFASS